MVIVVIFLGIFTAGICSFLACFGPVPHTERKIDRELGNLDFEDFDSLEEYMDYQFEDEDLSDVKLGAERISNE